MSAYLFFYFYLRPVDFEKCIDNPDQLKALDEKLEIIDDCCIVDIDINEIFAVGKLFNSKEECLNATKPKARFFCHFKSEKVKKGKFRLVPLCEKSSERLGLVLKRVQDESSSIKDLLNSPHGKWMVKLNRITEDIADIALNSIENVTQRTPKRIHNGGNETPKKKIRSETPRSRKLSEDVEEVATPMKRGRPRKSLLINENSAPSTPSNKGIPARRKSILKTPTTSKVSTPRRSIQFSGIVEEYKYEKKSALDKIVLLDESDEERSDLAIARKRLHVSAVPTSLPCREKEFTEIYSFLEGNLIDEVGGCIYVSGVPGTGKTATTTEVIRALKKEAAEGNLPNFECVEINGMRITEPRKAYVEIYRQLTGKTVTWEQAYNLLDKRFTTPSLRRISTILLVDELDILCNKRQDVVYNLLNWPNLNAARLIVVTIANTMDLPERVFMGKVTSRLGLTRLTFQPYSHKQLQEIVASRLSGLDSFSSDAIQLVARKVAALSGDARRALDICRRASEIAEADAKNDNNSVTMSHVQQALNEMISCTKVKAVKACSKMEKFFLQAVCVEVERTGIEEVTFRGVFNQLKALSTLNGVPIPSTETALGITTRLGSARLLICEHARKDIYMKILLNISADDFYYATQLRHQD